MTTEFELIRRYTGAFSPEECQKLMDYIDDFENSNLLIYDTDNLHQKDDKTNPICAWPPSCRPRSSQPPLPAC